MRKRERLWAGALALVMGTAVLAGGVPARATQPGGEIVFADVGWDSIKLNNAIAGYIAQEVFGYTWTEIPGSTPIIHEALIKGEVDVSGATTSPATPRTGTRGNSRSLALTSTTTIKGCTSPGMWQTPTRGSRR